MALRLGISPNTGIRLWIGGKEVHIRLCTRQPYDSDQVALLFTAPPEVTILRDGVPDKYAERPEKREVIR